MSEQVKQAAESVISEKLFDLCIMENFVDFGIYDLHDKEKRLFVNGHEKSIWLEFNVDGVILDLMP